MQGPERHSGITSSRLDDLSSRCDELLGAALPVNGGRNLQEVFSELLRRLEQSLQFDYLGFGLFNPARNVIAVLFQAGEFEVPAEIPVLGSSLGLIVHQQQAIEIADLEVDDRFPDIRELGRLSPYHSLRAVPLATERRQLGGMCVARKTKGAFSEEDVRYIETAAQLVSLVLENALQGHVLRREKARLEALLNISRSVVSTLDLRKLFPGIAASIQRVLGQDFTNLALYDEATGRMRFYIVDTAGDPAVIPPGTAVPLSECPAGVVFREGEVRVFSESDLRQFHSELVDRVLAQGVRSICCLPLISRSKRLGSLGLASTRQGAFSEADLSLLTQIAAQVGLAVDNARAYDEIARFRDKLSNEKQYLESELRAEHNFGEIIGNSETLRDVLKQVEIAAPSDATVLVLGETGTGKELIARAVHRLSSRREFNFIKLNCAAIPTGLLESELFGHEKGAFTGAISQKIGRLELADRGTLFLDEIGEIPTELQPKLLRVLQDHEFERLGGNRTIRVNVRLVAATNRNLAQAVATHQFRSDLYYRLNVFPLCLPALRERPGDIPALVRFFVQKFARRMGKNIESIPMEIIREMEQWHWPGNIRELENFIERSVILTQGPIFYAPMAELRASSPDRSRGFGTRLQDIEREYILRILRESGGVIAGSTGAAARLGMKRTTLQSRLQKLGISKEEYGA